MNTHQNTIDLAIRHFIDEKTSGRVAGNELKDDILLTEAGVSMLEIYEIVVALEDRYGISIEEADLQVKDYNVSSLSKCIKRKLIRKTNETLSWKDAFESIVFSGHAPALKTPLTVHLDPTFRCTSRCIFCYDSSGGDHGLNEMTTDELKKVIDGCRELDVFEITFGGGEPFIRNDFLELLRYVKQQRLRFYILSNGTLITKEVARELSGIMDRRFDKIQVSLDGPNPEIHDRQRGVPGTFEKTISGIRNLMENGIMPVVNTVLTKINYEYIPDMIPFLINQGIQVYRVLRLHPLGRCKDLRVYNELKLAPEQTESIFEFLFQQREELVGQLQLSNDHACIFPMSARLLRSNVRSLPGIPPASYACGAGTSKLSIGPDGSVYPCAYMYEFPELKIGSVRENSMKELWENDALWKVYREPLVPAGKCARCDYLYHCKTGCRILSYSVYGDMGAPDPGCYYEPSRLLTQEPVEK